MFGTLFSVSSLVDWLQQNMQMLQTVGHGLFVMILLQEPAINLTNSILLQEPAAIIAK